MLDELSSGFHAGAHQDAEDVVGLGGLVDEDLLEDPSRGVHGGLPELLGVHFAEPLEPLDVHTLLSEAAEGGQDARDARHVDRLAVGSDRELVVGLLLADLLAAIRGRPVERAEIGVDPGRRIGIALALDGVLVHGEIAGDAERLGEILDSLGSYEPRLERICVKVGDSPGSAELARVVLERASRMRGVEVRVQLVSEYEAERRVLVRPAPRGDLASAVKILLSEPKATLYSGRDTRV